MADLNPDALNKLKVVDLREHLSNRGLPTAGLKAELVKRLRTALLSEELISRGSDDDSQNVDDEGTEEEDEENIRNVEEACIKAEEGAEEEARIQAEEEARIQAEEEARIQAKVATQIQAKEAAQIEAEKEAQLRVQEEERIRAEEAKKRVEEEKQRKLNEEIKRKEEGEKQIINERRIAEEERIKHLAEEAERIEEERIREVQRKVDEEEMRREQERWLVEEQMRQAQEDHKKRIKAEEEKRKIELERQKKIAEEQQKQLAEEQSRKVEEQRLLAEEERKKKELELQQRTLKNTETIKNEQLSYQNIISTSRPTTLQMPLVLPFSSMTSVNIIPPPTVLMSNIPPLLPPGTSLPPNSLQNIPVPSGIFPPMNIMKAPLSSSTLIQNSQETILNGLQQSNASESENNNEITESMDTSENAAVIKLPQALEKVLALKNERAQLLGVDPDSVLQHLPTSEEKIPASKPSVVTLVLVDEDEYVEEDDTSAKRKESKRRRRKKKKPQTRNRGKIDMSKQSDKWSENDSGIDVDIEYVQEVMDISDPLYSHFMRIFEKFKLTEKENEEAAADSLKNVTKEEMFNPMVLRKKPLYLDDDEEDDDKLEEEKPKLSKRKLKKLSRMTVAELKQKVNRPELVEMHDVTAKDPVLLLHLKASRNTVPVPRHWCFKRKYLQGKRGIEKPAFELPAFIKNTGIMEMRQALQEKEDQKTMKAKMRERVRPKLGKIDIDYQKLHDAFFKWQMKPKMTIHGDLYYEGKEFETRLKEKKPGDLSEDLRTALGMPTGPNANKCPPPWLIAMQRYGPPPSYPNLKIPGLNAPIPDGCSFGYHAGGWGKPPVDETGRPLYGDVFGMQVSDNQPHIQEEEIDYTLWGELESESSEEEEEEEEEEDDEEEKTEDETGLVTPAEGLITPSGFSSIPAGMETPDMIELRKRKVEAEMEGGETPALYTILPEKKTERVGAAMMGSTHIYDLAAAIPGSKLKPPGTTSVPPQGIEVALDPSELEMDTAAMAARYEQTMREQQSQLEKEDLSDMVAEHAARQKNKRKKQQLDNAKPPKKYKEFKF